MSVKNNPQEFSINKLWLRKSFANAASTYNDVAVLQKEVAKRLVERLEYINIQPQDMLDLGSGTGFCSELLEQRYKNAQLYSLDIAHGMLKYAKSQQGFFKRWRRSQQFICGDAEALPLQADMSDMIISSLALQWCYDLDTTFQELHRVIKPGGLLMFATLGPDTLKELRQSWKQADDYAHVSGFIDMHDIGDALMRSGFNEPVMDVENITLTYNSVDDLMRDLKNLGSRNALQGRATGLTGKNKLKKMKAAYENHRREGVLPATYEVVYGHAWVSEQKMSSTYADTSFPIPVKVEK